MKEGTYDNEYEGRETKGDKLTKGKDAMDEVELILLKFCALS